MTEIEFMLALSDMTDEEMARTPIGDLERRALQRIQARAAQGGDPR